MARELQDFRAHLALIRQEWPDQELVPIRKVSAYLGSYYKTLLRDEDFPVVKVGNRNYVPRTGLARWLSGGKAS